MALPSPARPSASGHVLPGEHIGTDKQVQGCAGEGLKLEGPSPRLRARLLVVTCKMLYFGKYYLIDGLHL